MTDGGEDGCLYLANAIACAHPPLTAVQHGLATIAGPVRGGHGIVARLGGPPPGDLRLTVWYPHHAPPGPREAAILCKMSHHLAMRAATGTPEVDARRLWSLTPREHDVAELVAAGLTNDEIAEQLFISIDTVKKHLTHALSKTGCRTRTQLAITWQAIGSERLSA
ncbi:helix-turn-helix transcriptional regulator [Nonomuraea sp. NPDC050202]|uniref:helix-turn-helix transcriptional regulator n=1 Tax=Nonomuraea sp. NPDC050202 TaxID=3155035 RepID=UPI0033EC4179